MESKHVQPFVIIIMTSDSENYQLNDNDENSNLKAVYTRQKIIYNGRYLTTKYTIPHRNNSLVKTWDSFNPQAAKPTKETFDRTKLLPDKIQKTVTAI